VRVLVRHKEGERPFGDALQPLDGQIRRYVGAVPIKAVLATLLIIEAHIAVEAVVALIADELLKPGAQFLGDRAVPLAAEVPLADVAGTVTGVVQRVRERALARRDTRLVAKRARLAAVAPREQIGAHRGAERCGRVCVPEEHAPRGQCVEVRRVHVRVPHAAQGKGVHLVGKEEQDTHRLCAGHTHNPLTIRALAARIRQWGGSARAQVRSIVYESPP